MCSLKRVFLERYSVKYDVRLFLKCLYIIHIQQLVNVVCRSIHVLFMLFVFVCVWWCLTHIVLCFCFVYLRLVSCVWWCPAHTIGTTVDAGLLRNYSCQNSNRIWNWSWQPLETPRVQIRLFDGHKYSIINRMSRKVAHKYKWKYHRGGHSGWVSQRPQ
jgi:hypothetical protein